jgi:hypothetical protein
VERPGEVRWVDRARELIELDLFTHGSFISAKTSDAPCSLSRAIFENEDFQAKWRAAGWPEETFEVFELHNSGWPA